MSKKQGTVVENDGMKGSIFDADLTPPASDSIDGDGGVRVANPRVTGGAMVVQEKLAMARAFRQGPTRHEALVWELLRSRRLFGLKFRRQQVIRGFIVDFYCAEHRLVLELDGAVHDDQVAYDRARDAILARAGLRVVRLRNHDLNLDRLKTLVAPLLHSPE